MVDKGQLLKKTNIATILAKSKHVKTVFDSRKNCFAVVGVNAESLREYNYE